MSERATSRQMKEATDHYCAIPKSRWPKWLFYPIGDYQMDVAHAVHRMWNETPLDKRPQE